MRRRRVMRRRNWVWGAVLAVCVVGDTSAQKEDATPIIPDPDFSNQSTCPVKEVITGDTVVVLVNGRDTKVKLIGVSAPTPGRPYYDEAVRFLRNLLSGESVYIEYEGDAAGDAGEGPVRALLYRAPEGLFVNLEMVRQGYAEVADKASFKHREVFDYYQRKAQEAKKGVWQPRGEQNAKANGGVRKEPTSRPTGPTREITVFVTRTGKKYHTQGCQHLSKSSTPMKLSEAKQRGYTPCTRCKPPS